MRANVVIIGGGIIGTSIAYHLAQAGHTNVLLLERGQLGSGTSSKGVGGFRQQFDNPINVQLSQLSLQTLTTLGDAIELHQHGYMYLGLSPATWEGIQERAARQQLLGVPVELLSRAEIRRRYAFLNTDDVLGGVFCALDGYARPIQALKQFAQRAQAQGVQMRENISVNGIVCTGEGDTRRVVAVETPDERIETEWVINAAGPQAASIGALIGVDVPVVPLKRQVFTTSACSDIPRSAPLTIDEDTGFHFRPDGDGLTLAMSGNELPGIEDFTLDHAFGAQVFTRAQHRLPALQTANLVGGRAGLYEMTPDAHPILGSVPGVQGFLCACGFSGHGFMHSPAAGLLIAELITTGKTSSLDIAPLAITRFAEGRLLGSGKTL